jgi:hypothetical protein
MKTLFILFTLLTWITGLSQSNEPLLIEGKDYSATIPSTWKVKKDNQSGAEFFAFSPVIVNDVNNNVNFTIQDLSKSKKTLEQYTNFSIEQVKNHLSNYEIIKSETVHNHLGTHQVLIYQGTINDLDFKWKQYYWIKNKKTAYLVTYTALQVSFDKDLDDANKIMNSIKIKGIN